MEFIGHMIFLFISHILWFIRVNKTFGDGSCGRFFKKGIYNTFLLVYLPKNTFTR